MNGTGETDLADIDPALLAAELCDKLRALPYSSYIRCVASFVVEYRRLYSAGIPASDRPLVDETVDLVVEAAAGRAVQERADALYRTWWECLYPGLDPDADVIRPYEGPIPLEIVKICFSVLWELKDDANRYESWDEMAEGAEKYWHPTDSTANRRVLLNFLDRVDQEAKLN